MTKKVQEEELEIAVKKGGFNIVSGVGSSVIQEYRDIINPNGAGTHTIFNYMNPIITFLQVLQRDWPSYANDPTGFKERIIFRLKEYGFLSKKIFKLMSRANYIYFNTAFEETILPALNPNFPMGKNLLEGLESIREEDFQAFDVPSDIYSQIPQIKDKIDDIIDPMSEENLFMLHYGMKLREAATNSLKTGSPYSSRKKTIHPISIKFATK